MLVRIRDKYQITLPVALRRRSRLSVGGYVDIGIDENDRISLSSRNDLDRGIAEGRADYEAGRYTTFDTVEEMMTYLENKASTRRKRRRKAA